MKNLLKCIGTASLVAISVYWLDLRVRNDNDSPATLLSTATKVQATTCYECHGDIAREYAVAPHNRTLRRGNDPDVIALMAGKTVMIDGDLQGFIQRDGQLWASHSALPMDRRVDWVFGSGHHALTPVGVDSDPDGHPRLTQFNASLLVTGDLGATPGLGVAVGKERGERSVDDLPPTHGKTSDPAETRRCFGCHASSLPQHDGRIDLNKMVANIDCNRCHPGAFAHAQSGGAVGLSLDWASLTPLEAINRCGECHRRADEFTPDELGPEQSHLVRFAPVGMAMSECFVRSQIDQDILDDTRFVRFDCVTCHDPHSPAGTEAADYNKSCFLCHDFGNGTAVMPSARKQDANIKRRMTGRCTVASASDSCVGCHMPKRESGDGLFFTDHWIRGQAR